MNEVRPGVYIYDLGQNITGWVRLRFNNAGGHARPAAPRRTLESRRHTVHGKPAPREGDRRLHLQRRRRRRSGNRISPFTVFNTSNSPACQRSGQRAVTGCVVHSATPPAGRFECSHAGVNRLWLNGLWSQRDNFLTVPTDCPQRDERLGWMGDAQVFLRTASYNMDVAAFFTKWMIDVEDAQTAEGVFPDTAPRLREGENFVGLGDLGGAAGWADAGVIVPWTIWRVYGDRRIIERHWQGDGRNGWTGLRGTIPTACACNELGNNYGDWLCIPSDTTFGTHSPMKNLLATAYWADDCSETGPHGARTRPRSGREAFPDNVREGSRRVSKGIAATRTAADGRHPDRLSAGARLRSAAGKSPRRAPPNSWSKTSRRSTGI